MNSLIPVALYIPLKRFKYDWKYNTTILGYQAYNVIIVPQEQSTLSNLTKEKSIIKHKIKNRHGVIMYYKSRSLQLKIVKYLWGQIFLGKASLIFIHLSCRAYLALAVIHNHKIR
jgi:hypothetical protein